MDEKRRQDEDLLIDFHLGRCDEAAAAEVRARIDGDAAFRRLSADISNALGAMKLLGECEPPADLVDKTLARIAAAKRTEALLAREEARGGWRRPTFAMREAVAAAVAVILLGVIFIPSVLQAHRRALRAECRANVGQIGAAFQTYANLNDGSLPVVSAEPRRWLPGEGQPAVSNSEGLFKLVRLGRSPQLFQCPAVGGGSFTVQAGMVDFPSEEFVSYSYQHALGPRGIASAGEVLKEMQGQMAILADATPVFDGGRFRKDRVRLATSDNHAHTGQNVLYRDMHAAWATRADVGINGDNIYLAGNRFFYRGDEEPVDAFDSFLLPAHSGK